MIKDLLQKSACFVRFKARRGQTEVVSTDLVLNIPQLHYRDSDEAVVASEAVVFHSDVQLVRSDRFLVPNRAKRRGERGNVWIVPLSK